ncbi:MAG: hypothetical protein KGO81_04540 [Bacteroidota bacterium]|nr:hypothetical protein [Bacteroidota bacterium]
MKLKTIFSRMLVVAIPAVLLSYGDGSYHFAIHLVLSFYGAVLWEFYQVYLSSSR